MPEFAAMVWFGAVLGCGAECGLWQPFMSWCGVDWFTGLYGTSDKQLAERAAAGLVRPKLAQQPLVTRNRVGGLVKY